MTTLFTISFLLVAGGLFAKLLTEWLANRPEPREAYSPSEAVAEMEAAFVPRDILTFTVNTRSVSVMLHRMTESVGLGFGAKQADALAYRMTHQRIMDYFSATYPVEVNGVPSDLEFQWCREDNETVRLAICSVEEVLLFTTDAIADLAIEHHS